MKTNRIALAYAILGISLLSASLALGVAGIVNLTIKNPTNFQQTLDLILKLPADITPTNTRSGIWDASSRELTFKNLSFAPNETKIVSFEIEGTAGQHTLEGKMVGKLNDETLSARIAPFTITLQQPAEQLPPEKEQPPEETRGEQPTKGITQTITLAAGGAASALADTMTKTIDAIQTNLKSIRANEAIQAVTQTVLAPASTAAAAAGAAITITAITATAAPAIAPLVMNTVLLLNKMFAIIPVFSFKKKKPWGKIINEASRTPVIAARVLLIDAAFQKIKETQLTDREGRFGFLVTPGQYYLKIQKSGYEETQSQVLAIGAEGAVSNIEIILKPSQVYGYRYTLIKILLFVRKIMDFVNPVILAIGTTLATFIFWLIPSILNQITLIVYLVLDLLKLSFALITIKPFGKILDADTGAPISLAVIRIFDAKNNWLLATKITDNLGRYNFLTLPGLYYFTAGHKDYQPYQSAVKEIARASIQVEDIKLKKLTAIP